MDKNPYKLYDKPGEEHAVNKRFITRKITALIKRFAEGKIDSTTCGKLMTGLLELGSTLGLGADDTGSRDCVWSAIQRKVDGKSAAAVFKHVF